jgi:hypothetical protein
MARIPALTSSGKGCHAAATLGQVGRHFGRQEGMVVGALKGR